MYKRITKYHNKYLGEDVLFLGTGTSLLDFDLNKVNKNIFVFGFNHIIPYCFDFWPELKLDFYMCHDSTVLQMSFREQMLKRNKSESDYGFDLDEPLLVKYNDISPSKYLINTKLYEKTKIMICGTIKYPHADKIQMKQNDEWMNENSDILLHKNFLPYKHTEKNHCGATLNEDSLVFGTWAKNSFLNSGLPMLFYLGFKNVYLAGVDFNDLGNFFCKSKENSAPKYVPREFNELDILMDGTDNFNHKPNVYKVKSNNSNIKTKDGDIDFSKLI